MFKIRRLLAKLIFFRLDERDQNTLLRSIGDDLITKRESLVKSPTDKKKR